MYPEPLFHLIEVLVYLYLSIPRFLSSLFSLTSHFLLVVEGLQYQRHVISYQSFQTKLDLLRRLRIGNPQLTSCTLVSVRHHPCKLSTVSQGPTVHRMSCKLPG